MSTVTALQQLQAADSHLAALTSELAAIEAAMAGDEELDRLREAAAEAQAAQREADDEAAVVEGRAAQLRQRAKTIERRLFDGTVGNPQELLTLQHELEGVRERAAQEEERLLAAMEVADDAGELARAAQEAVTEREQARAAAAGPNAARLEELSMLVADAQSARTDTAADVEAGALALYTRLATRVRPALARLKGDSCGGCRHSLGLNEVRAVRHGDRIFQCPDCDRILVP